MGTGEAAAFAAEPPTQGHVAQRWSCFSSVARAGGLCSPSASTCMACWPDLASQGLGAQSVTQGISRSASQWCDGMPGPQGGTDFLDFCRQLQRVLLMGQQVPSDPGHHMAPCPMIGSSFLMAFVTSAFRGALNRLLSCWRITPWILCPSCVSDEAASNGYLSTKVTASRNKSCTCNLPRIAWLRL